MALLVPEDVAHVERKTSSKKKWTTMPIAFNFRDVAETDPTKIKPGRVFRSSELFKQELLSEYKIKTLLDMRKVQHDKETHPVYCALAAHELSSDDDCQNNNNNSTSPSLSSLPPEPKILKCDFISTNVGLYIVSKMPRKIWWDMFKGKLSGLRMCDVIGPAIANPMTMGFHEFYKIIVDKAQEAIADALRIFADESNYPILMHCTHGKDRTGILCYMLEAICDVSREDIVDDYYASEVELKKAKSKYDLPIDAMLMMDPMISAQKENMEQLIDYIETKYGGLYSYFKVIGLTPTELDKIKQNLKKE